MIKIEKYINANEFIKKLKLQYGEELGWQCTINMSDVATMVEDMPAANVIEIKHRYWIENNDGYQICSECDEEHCWNEYRATYCDNCCTKMDKKYEKKIDYKKYAQDMKQNIVKDQYGNIVCSYQLWKEIANIIENIPEIIMKEKREINENK